MKIRTRLLLAVEVLIDDAEDGQRVCDVARKAHVGATEKWKEIAALTKDKSNVMMLGTDQTSIQVSA